MELRHGYHHGRGRAQPGEPIENSGVHLQFGDLAVEVMRHDAFTKQLEAMLLGLDKAAPVIAAPLFPDFPSRPARSCQDSVTCIGTRTLVHPWLGVLANGDIACAPSCAIAS